MLRFGEFRQKAARKALARHNTEKLLTAVEVGFPHRGDAQALHLLG